MTYLLMKNSRRISANFLAVLFFVGFLIITCSSPAQGQNQRDSIISPKQIYEYTYAPGFKANVAQVDAVLNIIANLLEIAGVITGLVLICRSVFFAKSDLFTSILKESSGRLSQFLVGCMLIAIGMSIPDFINRLHMSARGAYYFS